MSRTRRKRPGQAATAWAFSAPGLLLLAAFMVLPFALALGFSFTNERLISPLPTRFVGLDNYVSVLTDATFWRALRNNAVFVLVVVPVQTTFALWLAVLVNRRLRGSIFFRSVFFLPVMTVMAAAAVVWTLLFHPRGLVNAVMELVTFGAFSPDWLNSTTWALPAIMIVSIWQGVGFQMIVLLAALQDVPDQLYEAAALDGATGWQQFTNVTLPGIRNGLIFVITVTTIMAFRLFDQVWIMPRTPGGPLNSTRTVMLEMVETGFGQQQIGRGSAIAVVFFLIVLLVTLVQRLFLRERREGS
ncbi:sugar ABC transporter permease [Natronosporangium hydrolyticum]|uniref:Sugar ABC transporter permease n=1 Tax=Natronosporangium hydrolyticum TaxID=2811111 RepID=A0A895YA59_9ACTN|nr:sugar ABC transporter permease [Natronosporangium hydrolyticum]QSB13142.1 sugar ABC transporter permease [Natronosporangium hydrolyticum]